MEAGSRGKRPIVVDFLVTLFVTFCIGVVASLTLVGSVILMAGDARGAEPPVRLAPGQASQARPDTSLRNSGVSAKAQPAPLLGGEAELRAKLAELALAHHLATKYASLVALDRAPLRPADLDLRRQRRD